MTPKLVIIWVFFFLRTSLSSECQCSLARRNAICNFIVLTQFVPQCFPTIKITTTCDLRVNIFPGSPALAAVPGVLSYYPRYSARLPAAPAAARRQRGISESGREAALAARRGRGAPLARPPRSALPPGRGQSQQGATEAARQRTCWMLAAFPNYKIVPDKLRVRSA